MDEDEVMPPSDQGVPLDKQEREILSQWILQGANYEPHWAFVPPVKPPLPPSPPKVWGHQAMDRFILRPLGKASQGLGARTRAV